LSIIDIAKGSRLTTILLDDLHRGAPNPYSIVCSSDGQRLWISHAAVHEISVVRIDLVHQLLAGKLPPELATLRSGSQLNIWARIKNDRGAIAELPNELTALRVAEAIRRFPSGGLGPRDLTLSHDERELLVTNYYSGTASILDATSGGLLRAISLGEQSPPDAARRGELIFHDATRAFQRWQSCSSCHPNQARVDGLRWDFLRDGIGNGKDTPSLLLVGETEPLNRLATRANLRVGARTGFTAGHFMVPAESEVDDLLAYLGSLRPELSPYRDANGNLSAAAQRGKTLFFGSAVCAACHPPPMFTDKKLHNIGVISDTDPDGRYDTPTLIEGYRTAPYLHDGRALTLKAVFTDHDPSGLHGKTKTLSKQELDDLVAYLQSL
jgi:mono/diheme cytochrome c family protein